MEPNKIPQYVILHKDGTYTFSCNLPVEGGKPVVGVFNCEDCITEKFNFDITRKTNQ